MADGRAKNGGARPGAGRKRKADELELQSLLIEAWPLNERRLTLEKLALKARGDTKDSIEAARLLLAYTYGKPIDRQEVSGPDGAPLKAYVSIDPDDWDNESPDSADSAV
jgi:hypothetical protein